ncbi:MAG: hypothetical protein KME12_18140 [Trichocoleus desertorum ATA4-8-CV12]|jgi:hypothetical protein|nr:hypothetical protein [Trichocoleus desertorum ATA4-8-CV12]
MNTILTPTEISDFRAELSDYPQALVALDVVEDCEGDLEDAAIALAIHVGQQPTTSEGWIAGLAKRWRPRLCQAELRADLETNRVATTITQLVTTNALPWELATLVSIYAAKAGIDDFCKPLEEKL